MTDLSKLTIDELLERAQVPIYTDSHFVYTSGKHGNGYANLRILQEEVHLPILQELSYRLVVCAIEQASLDISSPIVVLGPETMGVIIAKKAVQEYNYRRPDRPSLAGGGFKKDHSDHSRFIWQDGGGGPLMRPRSQVIWVDDLHNTGSTWRLTRSLVENIWPNSIKAVATIVDRSQNEPQDFDGPPLVSLKRIRLTVQPETCQLCEEKIPIVRRPGHGWKFEESNPNYPGGFVDQP